MITFNEYCKQKNLNEIFQSLDLKDVRRYEQGNSVSYEFHDFIKRPNSDELMRVTYDVICIYNRLSLLTTKVNNFELQLEFETEDDEPSVHPSKFGNWSFVYGKLLACIKDLIETKQVDGIHFTPATAAQALVYNKMLEKFNSMGNPKYTFLYWGQGQYLSEDFISRQRPSVQQQIQDEISVSSSQQQKRLQAIKDRKNQARQQAITSNLDTVGSLTRGTI